MGLAQFREENGGGCISSFIAVLSLRLLNCDSDFLS